MYVVFGEVSGGKDRKYRGVGPAAPCATVLMDPFKCNKGFESNPLFFLETHLTKQCDSSRQHVHENHMDY